MCRLVGIVSNETGDYRIALHDAPRSLAALSHEHPDGWGIAVANRADPELWRVHKGVLCAKQDEAYKRIAAASTGELLIAHVRQKTVGPTSIENTHPFRRGSWVFAHNGTVRDIPFLRSKVSPSELAELKGQTDSELFFGWILTRLQEAGLLDGPAPATREPEKVDAIVSSLAREARRHPGFGSVNFLLSDGVTLYAHRFGRSMHLLERGPTRDRSPESIKMRAVDGTTIVTPWSPRRHAILVASEALTDERWEEVQNGTLLRLDAAPHPRWRLVDVDPPT